MSGRDTAGAMRMFAHRVLTLCIAIFASIGPLIAHEVPRGEVYPEITAKDGNFIVKATDTNYESETQTRVVTRVVSVDGSVKSSRSEVIPLSEHYGFGRSAKLDDNHSGEECPWQNGRLVVPDRFNKHGGRPWVIHFEGNAVNHRLLDWRQPTVDGVKAALADGDNLYLLVSRVTGKDQTDVELWLHLFSLTDFKEKSSVRLPDPSAIYTYPICSKLIFHSGSIYLAVLCPSASDADVILLKVDGAVTSYTEKLLARNVEGNTNISLDHIGAKALVAYHSPDRPLFNLPFLPSPSPEAKVRLIPVRLD